MAGKDKIVGFKIPFSQKSETRLNKLAMADWVPWKAGKININAAMLMWGVLELLHGKALKQVQGNSRELPEMISRNWSNLLSCEPLGQPDKHFSSSGYFYGQRSVVWLFLKALGQGSAGLHPLLQGRRISELNIYWAVTAARARTCSFHLKSLLNHHK